MATIHYNQFHPLLLDYIERALKLVEPKSEDSKEAVHYLVSNKRVLGLGFPQSFPEREPYKKRGGTSEDVTENEVWVSGIRSKRYQKAIEVVQRSRAAIEATGVKPLKFFRNIEFFKQQAGLDDDDVKILTFYAAVKRGAFFKNIFEGMRDWADEDDYFRAIESLVDIPAETVKDKIYSLARFGLIEINRDATADFVKYRDNISSNAFKINDHFCDKLLSHTDEKTLLDSLIGERAEGELSLDDFDYMQGHARHLIETVKGASNDEERKNKNFGVYGVPGVGKTKFMAVIARETGIPVYFVGSAAKQAGDDPLLATFKEPKRSESLGDLLRASFIAKRLGIKVILVKDEAEGILAVQTKEANKEDTSNKSFINYFLDNNETPTIFITNDLDALQLATKRRLVSWTAFRQPPTVARAKILTKQFAQCKLATTDDFIRHLAEEFPELSPGVTAKILQDIGSRSDVLGIPLPELQAIVLDQFKQQELALNDGINFAVLPLKPTIQPHPVLWATDIDLDKLNAQLSLAQNGFLLTLVGPFGSGKKSFAHAYAAQQGKRLIERSSSDIPFGHPKYFDSFSDFVEATKLDNGVILLSGQNQFAEADAFVYDHYLRLVEISRIPTILTIDGSADIRPPIKIIGASFEVVHFRHLSPIQSMLAYHHFFGRPAPAVMQTFKTLTPAIFVNLKKVVDQTGVAMSDEEIVEKLHRRVAERRRVGLVSIDTVVGYSEEPEAEIGCIPPMDYRVGGKLLVKRIVPLTLVERYNMLKTLPKKLKWRDVAPLINEPDRSPRLPIGLPEGDGPTLH